ncbi:MAG TPA: TonB-dependent receptor [Candidatus Acidoferrales bacterium]|nr:TonB-dependent receptor [Candidatus Acidoferrales bacterium]
MRGFEKYIGVATLCVFSLLCAVQAKAQATGASTVQGTVVDPSGGIISGATVEMKNPVSGYDHTATTDESGKFEFDNVPLNPYHMTVRAIGFASYVQDVDVTSAIPTSLKISLKLSSSITSVTVTAEASDLVENDSTYHTDIDRQLFNELPLESQSSSLSSLVTLASPGVSADSNGLFHGMGDHAENSFSVDGQPITDQQSKVFSNQIPVDAVQSMTVISGAPPAEYGDKTSLVVDVATRSGEGQTTPHGSLTTSYGTFGSSNATGDLGYGGANWGNFVSVSGLNTGRFLDPPEFAVMHAKGNEENFFDRMDYRASKADSLQLNLEYTRSWFQNPNSFDQEFHTGVVNGVTGLPLDLTDQRSQIKTYNVAPTWTRLINSHTVFTLGGYTRHDNYNYYPSSSPLNDLAPDLQAETAQQNRLLTNTGAHSEVSYVKGMHNIKVGADYSQTFLTENDGLGIVDPAFNAPCLDANGNPVPWFVDPGLNNPTNCAAATSNNPAVSPTPFTANTGQNSLFAAFNPLLGCIDLTRPTPSVADGCTSPASSDFLFHGHGDIKELGLYGEDTITAHGWSFNLGVRGDLYNGLTSSRQAEPRMGVSYNIKPSSTVLSVSYARTLETPFNENLIIASTGCDIPVVAAIVPPPGVPCAAGPITPGFRNEFHVGVQQAIGKHLVVSGEYIWKYTHNGFDFGVVGATPITFPIEWQSSKIPGYALRVSLPNYHGLTALSVMSHVAARFFLPQVAGIPIVPPATGVFRIDHDENFNQTTHIQYQPWKDGAWIGFNWRYDSGQVAGATPCFNPLTATCQPSSTTTGGQPAIKLVNTITGLPLTADQQFQAGFTCNGVRATPTVALPATCLASEFGSTLIKVPAPGTENDDHSPQRIQPRSLFDVAVGDDNLFDGDRFKWSLRVTAINVMNKLALYNFLSTFSGTHYVTPRTVTGEIGFHF